MLQLLLIPLLALPVGEKLGYRVKYGPLTAGTLTLEVRGEEEIAGESCYHLVSHLESNPAYAALFTLDDVIESYARTSDFVTLRSAKNIHESRYENQSSVEFDYTDNVARYSDGRHVAVPGETRDLVSLWYYFRNLRLRVGDEFVVAAHVDKKNYDVRVSVTGRKKVRTRLGTFRCQVIEMESSGAVSGEVYLSDDRESLPVVIRTRMPLGYLTATLTSTR
jgi:hypothetical protein